LSIPQYSHGDDLDVTGDLDVAGVVDIHGNSLSLGSWNLDPSTPGFGWVYQDGATGSILWQASRPSAEWVFQHAGTGGSWATALKIDASHRLVLFDPSSGNSARIILDPVSTSTFEASVNFLGSSNLMPNQTLSGSSSILTAGLGDARYARIGTLFSATSSQIFGLDRSQTWNGNSLTITAGSAATGGVDRSGGTLVLSTGASNGAGWGGSILFQTASSPQSSGGAERPMETRMKIDGPSGGVQIGSGAGSGFLWADASAGLDIAWGGIPATLVLGAETNLKTRTNNTVKSFSIAFPPFNTSQRAIMALGGASRSDRTEVAVGGGSSTLSGATDVIIFTGTSHAAVGALERMRFDRYGNITINNTLVQNATVKIKGNVDENLFVARGTNDSIGIGISAPQEKLHVGGNIKVDGSASISGGVSVTGNLAVSSTSSITLPDGTVLSASNTLRNVITSGTALTISGTVPVSQINGLSAVATTGAYSSLTGLPTIPVDNNQLANGAGYITASGTAAFAQASGTAAVLSGTIQATQVAGLSAVATGGNYSSLSGLPTIPADTNQLTNGAGYVTASGTTSGITLSGTTKAEGDIVVKGGLVVTGTAVQVTSGTTTITKIVSSGTNQLVLIPEQGDLSMGTFTAGPLPQ
jgi:hypothetical protein